MRDGVGPGWKSSSLSELGSGGMIDDAPTRM